MGAVFSYSGQNFVGTLTGLGGMAPINSDAGLSADGVSLEAIGDKNTQVIGISTIINVRSGVNPSLLKVSVLKTSPLNAALMLMYNFQNRPGIPWGMNVFAGRDIVQGDTWTLTGVAFKRLPPLAQGAEPSNVDWEFDVANSNVILGVGVPTL